MQRLARYATACDKPFMSPDNLFEILHGPEVEQSELEQILGEHFKSSMGLSSSEITYPGQEKDYALRLIYDRSRLAEIAPGPTLTAADVDTLRSRIEKELLTSDGARVGRVILFSSVPVTGCFRYDNLFQLVPVPPDAPRPAFTMGEHPFLLEFSFRTSPNASIRHVRRAILERELELLASGLLEFGVRAHGKMARHHWVLPQQTVTEPWRSVYLQEMYTWPGLVLEDDNFTDTQTVPRLVEVPPADYYTRSGIGAERVLEIPANLESLLGRLFALPREYCEAFLRACFWFQHARTVHSYSRSAAFTAAVSAIEALMPDVKGPEVCEKCGRPIGVGPTKLFIEFVERFAPGGATEGDRRKLYSIRSKLSHGGSLLFSDRRIWSPGLTPEHIREWDDIGTAWRLVRTVLVNWLATE